MDIIMIEKVAAKDIVILGVHNDILLEAVSDEIMYNVQTGNWNWLLTLSLHLFSFLSNPVEIDDPDYDVRYEYRDRERELYERELERERSVLPPSLQKQTFIGWFFLDFSKLFIFPIYFNF